MKLDASSPTRYQAIGDVLNEEAERAANQLLVGASIIASVGVPISVSRFFVFGWNNVYSLHIFGLIVVLILCFFRHRLPARIKTGVILVLSMLVSLAGLFNYGLYGNGALWGSFAVFVASMFLHRRNILAIAAVFMLIYLMAAVGYVTGLLTFPADPIDYLQSPLPWGIAIVGSFFFVVLVIIIDSNHKTTTQRLILELENKTKQLAMMAGHDLLTELPNLRSVKEHTENLVAELAAGKAESAMFFIDLDGFKKINDTHGHDAGDHVLKAVAKALLGIVRSGDIVARVGGDEFVILLTDYGETPLPDLEGFAQRIIEAAGAETRYQGQALRVGASVGITRLGRDQDSYDAAVKRADAAMYQVKNAGKNGFRVAHQ